MTHYYRLWRSRSTIAIQGALIDWLTDTQKMRPNASAKMRDASRDQVNGLEYECKAYRKSNSSRCRRNPPFSGKVRDRKLIKAMPWSVQLRLCARQSNRCSSSQWNCAIRNCHTFHLQHFRSGVRDGEIPSRPRSSSLFLPSWFICFVFGLCLRHRLRPSLQARTCSWNWTRNNGFRINSSIATTLFRLSPRFFIIITPAYESIADGRWLQYKCPAWNALFALPTTQSVACR